MKKKLSLLNVIINLNEAKKKKKKVKNNITILTGY